MDLAAWAERRIFANMAPIDPKRKLIPVEHKDGSWGVRAEHSDSITEDIGDFQSESDAQDWIIYKSTAFQEAAKMTLTPKRPRDLNQWAKHMVDLESDPNEGKDAAAVDLGRWGGLKGGAVMRNEKRYDMLEASEASQ
jgi:hypothetical protein